MTLKDDLARYLASEREALLWKCRDLDEFELRMPRTPTGTNLLGLVKHCAFAEHDYLVECVGRTSDIDMPDFDWEADPNADLYATADESPQHWFDVYARVAEAVAASVETLELDSPAQVPWWGERGATTFGRLLVHTATEVARHAGHADILREAIDGAAGLFEGNENLGSPDAREAHVAKLTRLAEATR